MPPELSELSEPLHAHFSGDSKLEVVMEQRRRGDRRRGKDRRQGGGPAADAVERRLARELEGRRFGERRAELVPVEEQPALPPDLYGYADQLGFVRRVDGSRLDLDVARLKEMAAQWRDRCRDAEREATGLLRALVGVADDLGGWRTWSPRRFMAVHRAQRTIERYHQGHPRGRPRRRLSPALGGIVDREPGEPHVDPLAAERDALGFEEPALTRPLGQRPVGAHDALPGNAGVLACRHHRAGEAGRARTQVPVGGDEAGGDRTGTPQDLAGASGLDHPDHPGTGCTFTRLRQRAPLPAGSASAATCSIGPLLRLKDRDGHDDGRHDEAGPERNARWYPLVNADAVPSPPSIRLSLRVADSVASTARPSAPPTCAVVLTRPEARPASSWVAPDIASVISAGKQTPIPRPSMIITGRTCCT